MSQVFAFGLVCWLGLTRLLYRYASYLTKERARRHRCRTVGAVERMSYAHFCLTKLKKVARIQQDGIIRHVRILFQDLPHFRILFQELPHKSG